MTNIQTIGAFFPLSEEGFIINPTQQDNIPTHWQPVIADIVKQYQLHLGNQIHSIYLRGSVATGRVVDGFSDVDTFALLHRRGSERIRWITAPFQPKVERQLQEKYDFINGVEMQLATYHTADFFAKQSHLAMVIKTQSLCLFGSSIAPLIKSYRPDKSVCLSYRWLEEDLNFFLKKEDKSIASIQAILKVLLRTGFELVIEREGQFTTDLYLCYHTFSKYYPSKQTTMRMVLFRYLNPDGNIPATVGLVKELGMWLLKECRKQKLL